MAGDALNESVLGCKSYWDDFYSKELENNVENNDEGEVWFGNGCERRIVRWLSSNVSKKARICDLGCGNGHLLLELWNEGFVNLRGFDYSSEAVQLASKLAHQHESGVEFEVVDILEPDASSRLGTPDVVLDKGTYDAVSLMANSVESRAKYISALRAVMENHATTISQSPNDDDAVRGCWFFVITSCNWTKEELIDQFDDFKMLHEIPAPSITFGGASGQVVTTLVFGKT